MENMRR